MDLQELPVLTEEQKDIEFEERLARCAPIAKKIIKLIAEHIDDMTLGRQENVHGTISPLTKAVIQLMLDEKMYWNDKSFVVQLALQPLAVLGERLETSFAISWDKAVGKRFGVDLLDLTFEQVDAILREETTT